MKYTDEEITKAVESMVDAWDMDTIINFAVEDRLEYYLGTNVSQEEIEELVEENA
jgi:ethanolamine ammonia-lyase large subunit